MVVLSDAFAPKSPEINEKFHFCWKYFFCIYLIFRHNSYLQYDLRDFFEIIKNVLALDVFIFRTKLTFIIAF